MARILCAIVVSLVLGTGFCLALPAEATAWLDEAFDAHLPADWLRVNGGTGAATWCDEQSYLLPGLTVPYVMIAGWFGEDGDLFNDSVGTPLFDFTNAEQVILRYNHYLWNSEAGTYKVVARGNGFESTIEEYGDDLGSLLWGAEEIDITALVAGHDDVRVLWNYTDLGGEATGLWAVDNVEIWVLEKPMLAVSAFSSLVEGGSADLVVTRNRFLSSPLTVTVTAGDPALVNTGGTSVIAAGATSTVIACAGLDNSDPVRGFVTSIGVAAAGYAPVSFQVLVMNEDTDGDTLGDDWENFYFGSLIYGADDDPDSDLVPNSEEYRLYLDPTVADAPANNAGSMSGCLPAPGGSIPVMAAILMALMGLIARPKRG